MHGTADLRKDNVLRILLFACSAALMAYVVVRASTISMTFDEAASYMTYVRWDILLIKEHDHASANHHLLNIWGMWACAQVFGPGEFSLRLPNVLCFVIYLYAAVRFALRAPVAILAFSSFVLLTLHPYLLDFFSMARGYGMSNAFLLFSLWQLYRFATEGMGSRPALLAAASGALAALAHTMLLNYFLCLIAVLIGAWGWMAFRSMARIPWRSILGLAAIAALCLSIVLPHALGMHAGKALFFGSSDPWRGMMGSLARSLAYDWPMPVQPLAIMALFLGVLGVCCCIAFLPGWSSKERRLAVALGMVLLAGVLLALFLQHAILALPWPEQRTALFLVPMMAWLLVAALFAWKRSSQAAILACAMAAPVTAHFARAMNSSYAMEWAVAGPVNRFIDLMEQDHVPLNAHRPVVSVSTALQCAPTVAFAKRAHGLPWLVSMHQPPDDSLPRCDYHIVTSDHERWVEAPRMVLVARHARAGVALYRETRMQRTFDEVVHAASLPALVADSVGPDSMPQPHLSWFVPEDWAGGDVLVAGTVQALEMMHETYLTLAMDHMRDERVVEHRDLGSHYQVPTYGQWYQAGMLFQPRHMLLPGDEVRFRVIPYLLRPRIHLGEVRLVVTR